MAHPHDNPPPPSDVCLLLRAHAEQRWLSLEVVPVLRQLQQRDSLPEEQLGAALAYLEVLWIEAAKRATETDAAYAELEACEHAADTGANGVAAAAARPDTASADDGRALPSKARRYHAAVLTLREVLARNVSALLATPSDAAVWEHAHP